MARILLIDDERNLRRMVEMALRHAGHEVVSAPDGPGGLELFGEGRGWDLVLVDERMPGMTGKAVIRELLCRNPAARAIMLTAFATSDLASEAARCGAVDFLRKPFSTGMLRGAVQASLFRDCGAKAAAEELVDRKAGLEHFLNGFRYHSVPLPPGQRPNHAPWACAFEVTSPLQSPSVCVVSIMPHVFDLVPESASKEPLRSQVWRAVCESTIAAYLWEHGTLPPPSLPVFELSLDQYELIRRLTGHTPALSY